MHHKAQYRWLPWISLFFLTLCFGAYQYLHHHPDVLRPLLKDMDDDDLDPNKHRTWNADESQANRNLLNSLSTQLAGAAGGGSNSYGTVLDGNWSSRGPHNKPGSFCYADVDSATNTVWALTDGHYSGDNFIFKGTLAGDNFKMISGALPTRINDLIGFKLGSASRVLISTESGLAYYSDNDGGTWTPPTGLPSSGILSISLNRTGGYKAYAADSQKVYLSNDSGRTYSVLQDFGNKVAEVKVFSIRYGNQPGAGNVYLARNGTFYKLSGSNFASRGTYTQATSGWGRFEIQGDTRRLYLQDHNKWFYSTDEGSTWTSFCPQSYYYNSLVTTECMIADHTFGVNPTNPNIIIGGYSDWLISTDGGNTATDHYANWGSYQGGSTVAIQDSILRIAHHPDLQGSMFFYDNTGTLLSLRASDGGLVKSYNEWTISSFTGTETNIYYNISLYNLPSQEAYQYSLITGANNPDHIAIGTQDQGDQATKTTGTGLLDVLMRGGDGGNQFSGDGLTAFRISSDSLCGPMNLYSGSTFQGMVDNSCTNHYMAITGAKNLIFDNTAPSTSFWSIGTSGLVYHVWNGSSFSNTVSTIGGSGTVQALAQSASTPNTIYALRGSSIYKSTNKGSTWANGVAWGGNPSGNCGLAVNPTDASKLLITCQSSNSTAAAYSSNSGSTWINVTGSLPKTPINDLKVESTGRMYFASTGVGPYFFDSQTSTWTAMASTAVPAFNGMTMNYIPSANIMRFSTFGQGIWDYTITSVGSVTKIAPSTLPTSVQVNANNLILNAPSGLKLNLWIGRADGSTVLRQNILSTGSNQNISLPQQLPAGRYVVRISGALTLSQSALISH